MELEKEISQKKFRNETHKLMVNMMFTFNWINSHQSDLFKTFGISPQQFNVLRILRGQHPQPANVKLIRDRMIDKMSDASRIVEKLRVKGFIERFICNSDRRACEVFITDKGLKLLSKIDDNNDSFDAIFATLTKTEMKQMNILLDKLRG